MPMGNILQASWAFYTTSKQQEMIRNAPFRVDERQ